MLLLWKLFVIYVSCLSLLYCLVCSLQLCGLLCVMFSLCFDTFPYGVSRKVWYLSVSITDLFFSIYFVRPQLEYAAPIWDPYTKEKTLQLEKIQRRAARWTTNNYGLVTVRLPDYVQPTQKVSRYCNSMTFRQVQTNMNYYKYSFSKSLSPAELPSRVCC